ncbi:hydrophobe/amphiphile efflux-1 family RND transporter [Rhodoblastus sphagnicola]|uniref:Efflux pump membrane transporter n=1 Tax=Rhodoblastus sphagnicola TaxID=333368 RepID=A0A2S6MU99_9HYPH|nr:efflux RND transporter permease subunit [Rhodoblastus sphagnicola]MBB4200818.1 multidrug efflux pump [Rhodoblastus sphagnicola]PPQ25940.1 hydrophobe/amphiphile efflux-1 family RND transporter [Rhodoblastus sphagnicola]
MARFFIDRPIFAWVVALSIMLLGLLALRSLPIAQYPQIAPTSVNVTANYAGADAQTVEDSVTKVIEQGLTGLDNFDYMTATSTSTGQSQITITFTAGADANIAQVQVQNKLQLVQPKLPSTVQTAGITVDKATSGFLMVIGFISTDGSMNSTDLADYVYSSVNDTLSRLSGVGETTLFGSNYAMRIWLDPNKLLKYALMPGDVVSAITAQNTQLAVGQLGALPAVKGQQLNVTVTARSRLQTPAQFRDIILKSQTDGSVVRIDDVATVELAAENFNSASTYNGQPAAGMAISLASGANAMTTSANVVAALNLLSKSFPVGLRVVYPYDTTPFVKISIEEVAKTLIEAIGLVFVIMLLFLHNIRATLVPTLAVPVVLLGTFGVLAALNYSINTLTMFGMVLAIGLLVDDAIVVVENVERLMREKGLDPRQATIQSMQEISGALIGIATVLSAVFVPMAFFGGSVGVIYRQFSVTIVTAMALSVFCALSFTPALCATLLRPHREGHEGRFALWFDRNFERGAGAYQGGAARVLARPRAALAVFGLLVALMVAAFVRLPTSFLPDEDQGILIASVQLPVGATRDRTQAALDDVSLYFREQEKDAVESVFTVAGFGFGGQGQNVGISFIRMKDFDLRQQPGLKAAAVARRAMGHFAQSRDAMIFAFQPPAVQGMGNSNGFDLFLQDLGNDGHRALLDTRNRLLGQAARDPLLMAVRPNGQDDTPQLQIDVDQEKASAFGLGLSDVNATIATAWGSNYVNDFMDRGRVKKVYVQSAADFRMQIEDLDRWHVRNANGDMVPFSAFASSHWTFGSPRLERYNGVSSVELLGAAAPGASSGTAMNEIDKIAGQLPPGYNVAWTGLSYQEKLSGSQAAALYGISLIVVFLALAALYESWSIPFAVLLSVPVGILGALIGATLFGQSNDVYFKVGLLTTIGLSAKNAILIAEFAVERQLRGEGLVKATLEAARQRLRPILMTSFAFILGVAPLATASGAGSGAQNSIGIGVMCGMIFATAVGVFFIPMLFVSVRKLFPARQPVATSPISEAQS